MADLLGDDEFSPEQLYREGEWVTSWNEGSTSQMGDPAANEGANADD